MHEMLGRADAAAAIEADWAPGERGVMYGGATSGGVESLGLQSLGLQSPGADAAAIELRRALEHQARELDAVLTRFTEATNLMPTSPDSEWRGLAQLFYSWALDRLRSDLTAADGRLRSALHETRRAAESFGARVG